MNLDQNTQALILIFFIFSDRFIFSEQEYMYIFIGNAILTEKLNFKINKLFRENHINNA